MDRIGDRDHLAGPDHCCRLCGEGLGAVLASAALLSPSRPSAWLPSIDDEDQPAERELTSRTRARCWRPTSASDRFHPLHWLSPQPTAKCYATAIMHTASAGMWSTSGGSRHDVLGTGDFSSWRGPGRSRWRPVRPCRRRWTRLRPASRPTRVDQGRQQRACAPPARPAR